VVRDTIRQELHHTNCTTPGLIGPVTCTPCGRWLLRATQVDDHFLSDRLVDLLKETYGRPRYWELRQAATMTRSVW